VQLHPSFLRASAAVVIIFLPITVVAYLWQGYHEHHLWTRDYLVSLLIPFTIGPIAVAMMFVPRRLEFTDTHFIIQLPLRPVHTLSWDDLQYFGPGNNVFMIQFAGIGRFQIFAHAFPRAEWRALTGFLSATFPKRRASGYFGNRMFKWPWRKT
jgi:hypothetical protein